MGLFDFNISQIDESVLKLLEGLKIAFATSIIGMGFGIFFKIIQVFIPSRNFEAAQTTPEDILASLESINESLGDVRRAISADNDSSLLTQVQKLRTSIQDGQKDLIKEFRNFAETMARSNSDALIQALEGVIRDFNTQLNEQFGENFKQLNEAVAALLVWQENYRKHVETLEERIAAAVEGLEFSQITIEKISNHTEQIPETLAPLQNLLKGLQASVVNLESHLEAVGALRDKAIGAFPVIEGNIERLTTDFSGAVDEAVNTMELSVAEQRMSLDTLRGGYDELRTSSERSQESFNSALDEALQGMKSNLELSMKNHGAAIDASSDELRKQIAEAWGKTQEHINNQFETFDEQMQSELIRVTEQMGRNLASLSEKFVEDYTPLTDRLRDIIQIAERSQSTEGTL